MTENFKMRLSAEGGKPQKTLVSGKSLALEVKKEFSYKIYEQDIQFKICLDIMWQWYYTGLELQENR